MPRTWNIDDILWKPRQRFRHICKQALVMKKIPIPWQFTQALYTSHVYLSHSVEWGESLSFWDQFLNFGPLINISLISALRGLEISPNIFKWGKLSFPSIFCSSKTKTKFWPTFSLVRLPRALKPLPINSASLTFDVCVPYW